MSGEGMEPITGNVFAAEFIVKERKRRSKTEYLIKWKGWNTKHNSWEPLENILDPRLIEEYSERKGRGKGKKEVVVKGAVAGPSRGGAAKRPQRRAAGAPPIPNDDADDADDDEPATNTEDDEEVCSTRKRNEWEKN